MPMVISALIDGVPRLITGIINALPSIINALIKSTPAIMRAMALELPIALLKASPDIAKAMIWDLPRQLANSLWGVFRDLGKAIWDGLMSVFDGTIFGGGGGSGSWYDPRTWFANGGVVGGTASVAGDSRINDTIPAMLSAGEMVIPRSAMNQGMAGIMAFAANQLNTRPQGFANGGIVGGINTNNVASSPDSSISDELRQLRQDLNSIGYAIAKNTGDTSKKLKTWDVTGLPQERTA